MIYDTDGSATDGRVDHVSLVVAVCADGKRIQTVGGNGSRQVRRGGWFNRDTASSPVGAGPVLGHISPKD